VTLLGQSLGGHTAFLTAAAHPNLIDSLILIEVGPAAPPPDLPTRIATWLDSWPTPFTSFFSAADFLGHEAWARGLEEREDGLYPRFDRDTMISAITEPAEPAVLAVPADPAEPAGSATHAPTSYWPEWDRLRCPTLVVRGAKGTMPDAELTEMGTRRPKRTVTKVIEDAGHDVHLDQPHRFHEVVRAFLATS
jgi:pimeloyl-ACP methyl ester carboxylesterase